MQLSKFKPGGLVIGSLAPNIPHTPNAHPRRLRPTYTGDRLARVGGGEGGAGARHRREELHGGVSERSDGWWRAEHTKITLFDSSYDAQLCTRLE